MKAYIGIDIGKNGGIAYINESDIKIFQMPKIGTEIDNAFLYDIISNLNKTALSETKMPAHIIFEKLGVIFGSSKATAFSMGYQSGIIEMMCICSLLPYTKVPPKVWQKEIFTGIEEIKKPGKDSRDTKAMAAVAAKRLYPDMSFNVTSRSLKDHDGIIDALLIAEYARRKNI